MNARLLLAILAVAVATSATGQVTVKRYSVDGTSSSSTSGSRNTERARQRQLDRYPTALKFNVAPFFAGHYPVSLEYRLSPYVTVEGGLGLTTHNGLDAFINEAVVWDNNAFYSADSRVRPGSSQSANIKIFPGGDSYDDGFYLGFFIQNRSYSKLFAGADQNFVSFKQNFDQGLMIGTQLRSSDRIMVDLSMGLSNRYVHFPVVVEDYTIDLVTGQERYVARLDETQDGRSQNLGFFVGIKLGYLLSTNR
ncbi:MAG: hypothetical protein FJX93_00555 [Bacteroidetes bacterium]|nr:hypothetical protein [Bacteroidota bacterium]